MTTIRVDRDLFAQLVALARSRAEDMGENLLELQDDPDLAHCVPDAQAAYNEADALITQADALLTPAVLLTDDQRTKLREDLGNFIEESDAVDGLWPDAVWHGRQGVYQMTDAELIGAAEEWGIETP